ncbi:hypothetical protein C8Q72DRAFT_890780 [Fomitopsis betulina]|nr:hypothetical protein C8Q72DRAFT_890780 [Fomitopsis betulina]
MPDVQQDNQPVPGFGSDIRFRQHELGHYVTPDPHTDADARVVSLTSGPAGLTQEITRLSTPVKSDVEMTGVDDEPVAKVAQHQDGEDHGPWIPVSHKKCSHSLDSPLKDVHSQSNVNSFSMDQHQAICAAEEALSGNKHARIARRYQTPVREDRTDESGDTLPSRGEGTSSGKGKGIDPRNWGAAQIPDEELDIEAQHRAYKMYSNPLATVVDEGGEPIDVDVQWGAMLYWDSHRKGDVPKQPTGTKNVQVDDQVNEGQDLHKAMETLIQENAPLKKQMASQPQEVQPQDVLISEALSSQKRTKRKSLSKTETMESVDLEGEMIGPWPLAASIEAYLLTHVDTEEFATHRFICDQYPTFMEILDTYLCIHIDLPLSLLENPKFDLANFYAAQAHHILLPHVVEPDTATGPDDGALSWEDDTVYDEETGLVPYLALYANNIPNECLAALQCNAGTPRDFKRRIPDPIVIVVDVEGHPACVLLDTGSLADFMSSQIANQLNLKLFELAKPLPVHLAMQGSHAKINFGCTAEIGY